MALAAGMLSVGPPASAGHANVTVQVGAPLKGSPGESMRFFGPKTITVHQGDRITFDFRGFHTATLLPTGTGADEWIEENAEATGPYSFVLADPDDGAGAYKDNFPAVVTPSDPTCGHPDTDACRFTGDDVVNSGGPAEPGDTFTATVDAPAGSSFWIVCLIHHRMRMRVKVTGDPAAATPQTAIDQAKAAQLAEDTDLATSLHERYSNKRSSHKTASGRRVWDAWAGVEAGHVSLLAFYPKRLTVDKGDTVRWHFEHLMYEDHTVSMPDPGLFRSLEFDLFMCDPDDDTGAGPDTEAEFDPETGQPVCPEGSTPETDLSDQFWGGTGNGMMTGQRDAEHSGIRGAQAADVVPPAAGHSSYDLRFSNETGKNPIAYFCFIHPMSATVVVK